MAPPGDYRLKVFHERALANILTALERQIAVGPDDLTLPTISISEAAFLAPPHKNKYGKDYPAQIGLNMRGTDSDSFQDFAPSISMRENQRVAEIEQFSNPNHHQPTDVYATYSDADFHLGFTIEQATVGAVAELAGATITK